MSQEAEFKPSVKQIVSISISSVKPGHTRTIDDRKVKELAKSLEEVGLQQPIGITKDNDLVFGFHRLCACNSLGWKTIDAIIITLDELHLELAQIDENLMRAELSQLEEATLLNRRKEIYEQLHPETKRSAGNPHAPRQRPSFVEQTHDVTGSSRATIERKIQIATNLEDVADKIKGTPLENNQTKLLALSRLSPPERDTVLKLTQDEQSKLFSLSQDEQSGIIAKLLTKETPTFDSAFALIHKVAVPVSELDPGELDPIFSSPLDLMERLKAGEKKICPSCSSRLLLKAEDNEIVITKLTKRGLVE